MTTMKAYVAEGGRLVLTTRDIPTPGPGELVIKVHATAVNRADILQRKGAYPPPSGASDILGLEASGEVFAIGPDCQRDFVLGQKVMALLSDGGYAEYCVTSEDQVMTIPHGILSLVQAAAIPEAWLTAYQLLYTVAHVQAGETVLIHAGGSGVGTAAIQLVIAAGATPIVTAGREDKLQLARALGAQLAINYKQGSWAEQVLKATTGRGVDVVLDCIGAQNWEANADAIAVDGRWVLYGLMGGADIQGPFLRRLMSKRIQLLSSTLRARSLAYKAALVRDFCNSALPLFETGQLRAIIDTTFPFEAAAEAHTYVEKAENKGKVLISFV